MQRRVGRAGRPGRLRIVAGSLKGRRIVAPAVPGVRPTSEKVREALFDILGRSFVGGRVLDAFAGSGANGCEALSRGAKEVVFVESDPRVARILRANVAGLDLETRSTVLVCRAERAAQTLRAQGPYDLILADPPYAGDLGLRFRRLVAENGILGRDGRFVLESAARSASGPDEPGLRHVRAAVYGDTRLDFYETCEP